MHKVFGRKQSLSFVLLLGALTLSLCYPTLTGGFTQKQSTSLTPAQAEIEKQRQRLSSSDAEERRDALMRLGAMHRAEASREAIAGLRDVSPAVRAVAAKAILAVGADESVVVLLPLANDKDEFVRREAAYALGLTKSRKATDPLTNLLLNDKKDGVRAAAAVGLGDLADENTVVSLAAVLAPELGAPTKRKAQREQNVFVLRASAKSLGQIKSRAGVPALVAALSNEKAVDDVRREAARALGLIGDPAAVPALRVAATSVDPYLAQAAHESLKKITP
ncbi:MAG TPA: HEAT repeat domain-containing protein [Pyrinomonadaceae bacterium]|jgi:HEAT repeat protein|nr:HEAT repeat domain-containing protein [Pyrinomonadaceae bacterium]